MANTVNKEFVLNRGGRVSWPFDRLGRGKNQINELWVSKHLEKKIYTALSKWKSRHEGFNYKTGVGTRQDGTVYIVVKRVY